MACEVLISPSPGYVGVHDYEDDVIHSGVDAWTADTGDVDTAYIDIEISYVNTEMGACVTSDVGVSLAATGGDYLTNTFRTCVPEGCGLTYTS